MAKNILQDIVPPEKRSIRNIPVPNRRNKPNPIPDSIPKTVEEERVSSYSQFPSYKEPTENVYHSEDESPKVYPFSENVLNKTGYSKKAIWVACGGAVIIVLISFFSLFTGATVTVTPVQKTTTFDEKTILSAHQGQTGDGVQYEIVKISKDLGKSVPANGEESVEKKASGTIIVYNNVDKNPQRLIKNTRFETPEGLIFRINDSIVVPGQINSTTPGSVEVAVFADVAGEKYNIGLKDFTIPGFKTDANRYKNIYARSKTEMVGGFVGSVKKISDTDLSSAKNELHATIQEGILKDVLSQVPQDFVLYPDATFVTFESLPQSEAKGGSVTVNERGVLTGIIFKRSTLSEYLATIFAPELISKVPPILSDVEKLSFVMINKSAFNPQTSSSFTFTLAGNTSFISQYDSVQLLNDIVGKSKSSLPDILKSYPSISKMNAVVRPFWKRSLPSDKKDITIKTSTTK